MGDLRPCFLWVFAGAPYIERLQHLPALKGALEGVIAAVVGVIFNLTVWFGLHVFFKTVAPVAFGPLTLWTPELTTIEWGAVLLALLTAIGLFRFHLGLPIVLPSLAHSGLFGRLCSEPTPPFTHRGLASRDRKIERCAP